MEKVRTFIKKNTAVSIVILIVIVLAGGLYLKGASHRKEGGKEKVSKEAGVENPEKKGKKKNKDKAAQQQVETPAGTPIEPTAPANQTPTVGQ